MCTCVAGDESLIEDEVRQKAASPPGRVPHLTLRLYASVRVVSLSAALYVGGRDAARWTQSTRTRRTTISPDNEISCLARPPRAAKRQLCRAASPQAGVDVRLADQSRISRSSNVSKIACTSQTGPWTTRLER